MSADQTARFVILNADQGREQFVRAMGHARALIDNGERVAVTVGPVLDPIGVQQRRFYHGVVLVQISEQVRINGDRFTGEVWHEFFRRLFLPDKWEVRKLPGQKRATPQRVRQSTEALGPKAYSEHIDRVIAHAATEFGVEFRFIDEERQAVQYVRPRRLEAEPA